MSFPSIEENIKNLLNSVPELKNATTNEIINEYKNTINHYANSESIGRAYRKLKEKSPKFAPNNPEIIRQRNNHQDKVMKYVRNEN